MKLGDPLRIEPYGYLPRSSPGNLVPRVMVEVLDRMLYSDMTMVWEAEGWCSGNEAMHPDARLVIERTVIEGTS